MTAFKKWLKAAGIRALKTAAEGALIVIGTDAMFVSQVDWIAVLSGAVMGAVLSIIISIKGIPEVEDGTSLPKLVKEDE